MRISEIIHLAAASVTNTLWEAPFHSELTGRDGLPCRVWLNPSSTEFSNALARSGSQLATAGLRGLLTDCDLYVWQSTNLLHSDFERDMGVEGLRVGLRSGVVQANDETIALPEHFPWVFDEPVSDMDVEERRECVLRWLTTNQRLRVVYPQGFRVLWYS